MAGHLQAGDPGVHVAWLSPCLKAPKATKDVILRRPKSEYQQGALSGSPKAHWSSADI